MHNKVIGFMQKHRMALVLYFLVMGVALSFLVGKQTSSYALDMATSVACVLSIVAAMIVAIVPGTGRHNKPKFAPVGVNAPCPCGSGKKYKKCCMPR